MSYTKIINPDKTFPQGESMEELQSYISTELGRYGWTFFTIENEVYSWFKGDYHLRLDFWKKTISVTNIESIKEIIFKRVDSWKLLAYELNKELT